MVDAPACTFYAEPRGQRVPLRIQPRLASWMAAGHPDQDRLEAYLTATDELLQPLIAATDDPLALRLDVGMPRGIPLLSQHDLDNYLFPLVTRLSKTSKRRFVSAWSSKRHADVSVACIGQALPLQGAPNADRLCQLRTTASSDKTEYKQQIHDQLRGTAALPDGPVSLQIGFDVGPSRNWTNLWKPTIDALGALLGSDPSGRPWHPRDGRIVELGLHCNVDTELRNDVVITIAASTLPTTAG